MLVSNIYIRHRSPKTATGLAARVTWVEYGNGLARRWRASRDSKLWISILGIPVCTPTPVFSVLANFPVADFFDGKHNVVLGGSWSTHPRVAGRKSL